MSPIAILVHVANIEEGLNWYQKAFPHAVAIYHPDSDFTVLDLNGFSIEVVQADNKVNAGKKGTVLYWSVDSVEESLVYFQSIGATLYRGPMAIEGGLIMCQVEDPFGNLIGLRG
ncbi:glyoxalase/bleomycin resistance/dioxygenase family protein [Vibrio atlanticus]|uniref:Glyoxalase-like domain protein n=1 Tax=Vibrio atlanticus TaxID=693153 RepID=A0A1C3IG76_9VIBR|nr:glyoxalase/bleomycin resistance/dioxygenase family protein [Vibrio atlanticus]SBS60441.1 Glyoxalase-like domain protein [Vibrio atlanticus]